MQFTISVSRNEQYVFTAKLEHGNEEIAREVFDDLCKRMPAKEGFALSLVKRMNTAKTIVFSEGA